MRVFLSIVGIVVFLWLVNGAWQMTRLGPTGVVLRGPFVGVSVPVYATSNELAGVACRLPVGGEVQIIYRTGDMVRVKGYACTGYLPAAMVEVNE